uniref:MRN complex-interacting protein N-terminal domain-containing protein n=1 Tax=Timema bartmani TaxID=61472 RepID=A0A7R9ENP0_9NEOP|nr:unnamed protein product [Timema bartmani]
MCLEQLIPKLRDICTIFIGVVVLSSTAEDGEIEVQIVKKSNKWECKMCGEKQSVKQVYGRGSCKDCRAHVQKLNELRLKKEEFIDPSLEKCDYQNNECSFQSVNLEAGSVATKLCRQTPKLSNENDEPSYPKKRNSKWNEFLASSSSASSDDDDAMDQSHFKPHRGDNSREKIKKQKIASRHEEQFKLENKWDNFASNDSKVCAEDSSVHLNMSKEPTTYWRAMEGNVAFTLDLIVAGAGVSVSAVARCSSIDSAMPFAFSKFPDTLSIVSVDPTSMIALLLSKNGLGSTARMDLLNKMTVRIDIFIPLINLSSLILRRASFAISFSSLLVKLQRGGRFSIRWHRSRRRSLVSPSTFTRAVVMGVVVMKHTAISVLVDTEPGILDSDTLERCDLLSSWFNSRATYKERNSHVKLEREGLPFDKTELTKVVAMI